MTTGISFVDLLLNRRKATARTKAQTTAATYISLMRKAATTGKLSPADTAALDAAAETCRITPREMRDHAEAMETHARHAKIAAGLSDARTAVAMATAAHEKHRAETARLIIERAAAERPLKSAALDAAGAIAAAGNSAAVVDSLEARYAVLFGKPRRKIVATIYEGEHPAGEANPEAATRVHIDKFRTGALDSADYMFVPYPNQDPAQFAALVEEAADLAKLDVDTGTGEVVRSGSWIPPQPAPVRTEIIPGREYERATSKTPTPDWVKKSGPASA